MDEISTEQAIEALGSKSKPITIHIGYKAIVVTALLVVIVIAAIITHKAPKTSKLSPTMTPTSAGAAIVPGSGAGVGTSMQIVAPASAGGNVSNSQGSSSSEVIIPAASDGTKNICNGKEIAPTATGCTASGGVIFGARPQTLNVAGQDQ